MNASWLNPVARMGAVLLLVLPSIEIARAGGVVPLPTPERKASSKVTDSKGTTFKATWIAHNPNGGVKPEFIYQRAGQAEQRIATGDVISGVRPVKVSARVLGLTKSVSFEWRAFAGGGADDQDSETVPRRKDDQGNNLPGFPSVALSTAGTYRGIVKNSNGVAVGACTAKLTAKGVLTGAFQLFQTKYRFAGPFDDEAELATVPEPEDEGAPLLAVSLQSDATLNRIEATLVADPSGAPVNLTATLAPDNPNYKGSNPAPFEGRYTILFPLDPAHRGDAAYPQGESFAKMVISVKGKVKVVGKLADGEPFSIGSALDDNSGVVLFAAPYRDAPGILAGYLAFAHVDGQSDATGSFRWVKPGPASLDRPYDSGFATNLEAIASLYSEFARTGAQPIAIRSPDLTKAFFKVLLLFGSFGLFLDPQGIDDLTLKLDAKTGLFKGTLDTVAFGGPAAEVAIYGAILSESGRIGGFFVDATGLSGRFESVDVSGAVQHDASGLPQDIPDNSATGVSSSISVPETGTVADCRVSYTISHPAGANLGLTLTTPSGTQVFLSGFVDGNTRRLVDSRLSVPLGKAANGQWVLKVVDFATGNVGSLDSWSLKLTVE